MHREFLMGNEAIALGAIAAGVDLAAGYPGTPSTEVLETIARNNPGDIHVEWSVNEKAGMEVAAGAAICGARAIVTTKQVGLNVASDPLMSLEYLGVKGGLVVMVADDPGPISSQTEQDTRTFGMFSKVPVFDPSSVQEAYEMTQEAFEFSQRWCTPVFLRATTRIDHGYQSVEIKDPEEYAPRAEVSFERDPARWVIFPRLSVRSHARIEQRNRDLRQTLSAYPRNEILAAGSGSPQRLGIASHGINYQYVRDCIDPGDHVRLLKVATPFPFPEDLALRFLDGLDEVLCVEELDPVIERALISVCGRHHLDVRIRGKLTGDIAPSGENTVQSVADALQRFLDGRGMRPPAEAAVDGDGEAMPELPVRPPVLCAGCGHRAAFYAVKAAMKGKKCIFCGDIGCYTLANAQPLDMCDTCLCMGAGITMTQGVRHMDPETACFAFVGDSTFFASGLTGVVNACYNQAEMTLVVLDNSTTAMTGHQPHPGTGRTIMGQAVDKISIENVLRGIGLTVVETVNPLDFDLAKETVQRVAAQPGVKAIIFRTPCVAVSKPRGCSQVDPKTCTGCRLCIRELGCPGLIWKDDRAFIDSALCTGCTLCEQICPAHAIHGGDRNE